MGFNAKEASSSERVARATEIANLILSRQYKEAAAFIRPEGVISSGSDTLPEAIGRYVADIGCTDRGTIIGIVEDVVMGMLPRTVIPDLQAAGYAVEKDALDRAVTGVGSYSSALRSAKFSGKYEVKKCGCPGCQALERTTFSISEAKVGETLPPFSQYCHGRVGLADL